MNLTRLFPGIAAAAVVAASAFGGMPEMDGVVLKGVTDKDPCSYFVGEKMKFSLSLCGLADGVSLDGLRLKWKRQGDDGKTEEGVLPLRRGGMPVTTSISKPGFVHMEAWVVDSDGNRVKRAKSIGKSCLGNEEIYFTGGAAAGLRKISQGIAEPSDFNVVWKSAIKRLLRSSRYALTQPDALGAGAFPLRRFAPYNGYTCVG